jgi:uncharacterized protein
VPVLDVLDETECFARLASADVGRVVATAGGMPLVVPVSYVLDGHTIVFGTGRTGALAAATVASVVAFEVDEVDAVHHGGWSVVVVGTASAVIAMSEQVRVQQLGIRTLDGEHEHFVRITPGLVTGRLLQPDLPV